MGLLWDLVGLKGRKFYGLVDAVRGEYLVSTRISSADPPDRFGLEVGELAAGTYLRIRLHGVPPALYDEIPDGFVRLHDYAPADPERHDVEFYRRRDEVELWMPVI